MPIQPDQPAGHDMLTELWLEWEGAAGSDLQCTAESGARKACQFPELPGSQLDDLAAKFAACLSNDCI